MRQLLEGYKPAASARLHLLLAALMWTVVGALLLFFGGRWVLAEQLAYGWLLLAMAAGGGLLKAHFVLEPAAGRTIERIRSRGDGQCIGGFLSVRSWVFVVLMAAAGRYLRGELAPRIVVGLLYTGVGVGLLLAVRRLWHAWYRFKSDG